MLSLVAIKNSVCPHLGCSSTLFPPESRDGKIITSYRYDDYRWVIDKEPIFSIVFIHSFPKGKFFKKSNDWGCTEINYSF